MPTIDGASLNGLLSTPLVLGALAALLALLLILAVFRAGGARRLLLPVAVLVAVSVGVMALLDRMAEMDRATERRALTQRYAELNAQALAPGSTLACLDGVAGDAVETACEKTVFGGPQNTAAAVAYMAARLTLLSDGLSFARHGDPDFAVSLAGLRRAIELDRFGIAAHVLAVRDGCTAERCEAFVLLQDANVMKSNLKAQVFDQYVSRYAADWNKTAPVADKQPPVAAPAVSIMNPEPKLPKDATDAQAAAPQAPAEGEPVRTPPKRPQAASPPAR